MSAGDNPGHRPAAPIVKWAGGKSRLLGELRLRMPKSYGRYFEPFAGGAAVFFGLSPERAVLSDANPDLMSMYRQVADDVDGVIGRLNVHRVMHDEQHYYQIRDAWNHSADDDPSARAAAFIYLNKTCYNGLWRVNRKGEFNVPIGRHKNPKICDVRALRAVSKALQRATLLAAPYQDVLSGAERGDLVYLDPPYQPSSPTAHFTSYTSAGFDGSEQMKLAQIARTLVARGCCVVASNSYTPFILKLYRGFRIDLVRRRGTINAKADGRGPVSEVIITGRYISRANARAVNAREQMELAL